MIGLEGVRQRVQAIKDMQHDDEAAHSAEDALYQEVLETISKMTTKLPGRLAAEALKTKKIDFARWCA